MGTPLNISISQEGNPQDTGLTQEQIIEANSTSIAKELTPAQMSASEIVDQLAVFFQDESSLPKRAVVEQYKMAFYRKKNDAEKIKDEQPEILEAIEIQEDRMKDLLGRFRELNQKRAEAEAVQREENLTKKEVLISRLKELLESKENVKKIDPIFREIRDSWKSIGPVTEQRQAEIEKEYGGLVEQFYDLKKLTDEFREYDFKKNLEAKERLILAAEALINKEEVVEALKLMQKLQEEWREIGPVARDLRNDVWNKFYNACKEIHRKHQQYFLERKNKEQENLEEKEKICAEIESLLTDEPQNHSAWTSATEKVKTLQAKWKTIGFAPKKENSQIFERFRLAISTFFQRKSDFYAGLKERYEKNLEEKKSIVEQAKDLASSTEWSATTKKLLDLQEKWKEIGPVSREYSNNIYKEFRAACNEFFNTKKKVLGTKISEEKQNLEKKINICEKIEALINEDESADIKETLSDLQKEWRETGYVPFKEKENLRKRFNEAVDNLYKKFNLKRNERRLEKFKSEFETKSSDDKNNLRGDYERFDRIRRQLQTELTTYENNIGFLSASSKGGSGIIAEMERKCEKLKSELKLAEEKIAIIIKTLKENRAKK